MICKNCGTVVEEGTQFCAACGAAVEAESDSTAELDITDNTEAGDTYENPSCPGKALGIVSLILGIVVLGFTLTCGCGGFIGSIVMEGGALLGLIALAIGVVFEILLGIVGLILGIVANIKSSTAGVKNNIAKVGIILPIAAIALNVIVVVVGIVLIVGLILLK